MKAYKTKLPTFSFVATDWVTRNYVPFDKGPLVNGQQERLLYYIGSFGNQGVSMLEVLNKFQQTSINQTLHQALYCHRIIIQREDDSFLVPPIYLNTEMSRGDKEEESNLPFFDLKGEVIPLGGRLDNRGFVIKNASQRRLDSATSDFWNKAEQIFSWS